MSKRVKKPFNAAAEANRLRHEYPCNLFLKIFPEFDGAKFATVYVDNIKIILDIYKDNNIGFKALELFYDKHLTIGAICEILGVKRAGDYAEEAINIIKDNKDVIFNGFRYSKLRKSVISSLHKTGFSKITATALADCGLYSLSDIKNLKDGKTLINKLSKEFEPEVDTYTGMTCGYEFCNHTISCKHKQRCSEIYFHIENTRNTKKKVGF